VSVQLNHTIVSWRDQQRAASFLTGILGLPPVTRFGPFLVVEADNDVSLDFLSASGEISGSAWKLSRSREAAAPDDHQLRILANTPIAVSLA
jgi:catechol 2,3-dioxygenase-like lactoylglutathione lyase family enzyme